MTILRPGPNIILVRAGFFYALGLGFSFGTTLRALGLLTGRRFAWVLGHRKIDLLAPGIALLDRLALRRLHLRAIRGMHRYQAARANFTATCAPALRLPDLWSRSGLLKGVLKGG